MSKLLKIINFITIWIMYLHLSGCIQKNNAKSIKAIKISFHWEFFGDKGVIDSFNRTPYIIYTNEYWLLKDPYTKRRDDLVEGKTKSNVKNLGIGYDYYICKRGSCFGVRYRSLSDEHGSIYSVDSLINEYLTTPSTLYSLKNAPNGNITSDGKEKKIEKIANTKSTHLSQDSTYFYYQSKDIGIPFYNKSIKLANRSLYKCEVVFNEIPADKSPFGFYLKKRKWSFEVADVEVTEKKEILKLIERFKKNQDFLKKQK